MPRFRRHLDFRCNALRASLAEAKIRHAPGVQQIERHLKTTKTRPKTVLSDR
jgi:hypothetical protein